ncbi:MAG: TlpA family protein disulfide reductase, partial [Gammaproteobacteria bacterium]|nr:TlpA family protein disulfide reductase [Gammaproteobacteria bacterium]
MNTHEGIIGQSAAELTVVNWIDTEGRPREALKLGDFVDHFRVIHCFQSWCQGCHLSGFPALKK